MLIFEQIRGKERVLLLLQDFPLRVIGYSQRHMSINSALYERDHCWPSPVPPPYDHYGDGCNHHDYHDCRNCGAYGRIEIICRERWKQHRGWQRVYLEPGATVDRPESVGDAASVPAGVRRRGIGDGQATNVCSIITRTILHQEKRIQHRALDGVERTSKWFEYVKRN